MKGASVEEVVDQLGDVVFKFRAGWKGGGGTVGDFDREDAALGADDRGIIQVCCDRLSLQSGGHDDEFEVGADGLLDFAEEGQGEIGVEIAFVEFVEDDEADPPHAFQIRIVEELAGEDAFGEDADAGGGGEAFFEADVVADLAAEGPAIFVGDAFGGGAGGDAAGLEHDDVGMIFGEDIGAEDGGGDASGLAGAGRGDEDEVGRVTKGVGDFAEGGVDGEREHEGDYMNDPWGMTNDQ